ncbi:MAG: murein transglycosylase A [Proteobacteria bacterium]|nr:murein transglycosylase A [Pseudomonadota bacterium]MDA0914709.1 murein transglycosylase A [Pseudomonadota bacterium]MDA1033827.1 murein transglycosylase A [Pseudomonadota bacterium]
MNWRRWQSASAILCVLALASCARIMPAPQPPIENAAALGVAIGPALVELRLAQEDASAALASFIESCPKLLARDDQSGLTQRADWQDACDAAPAWSATDPLGFFYSYLTPVRVGDSAAFATGYFEPAIAGCRVRQSGCDTPVYAMPPDLVRAWPDEVPESEREGRPPLGRIAADGRFVPYYERAEIEAGALVGRGLEIAYASDPIELFFLQIQGSGKIIAPDGETIRIGYAGQNGREYVSIGGVMRERELFGDEPGKYAPSMQGIVKYLRENPEDGAALMRLNKSWVFFRELIGEGPLGALEVPVRRKSSVAVDPRFVPLGAPVWLDLDRNEADGLWIAQDTGGAIKGANRFDTFWGAGEDAGEIAGGMSGRGQALVLVPNASAERLNLANAE